jgi:Putative bacterial sensory transduction regulator
MKFENDAHKAAWEKIGPWMKELFGEFSRPRAELPMFDILVGSAWVTVAVWPWRDDDAVITVFSMVVTGAEITPDLMKTLLEKNLDVRFGAFGLSEQGAIVFQHAIAAASCDKSELRTSVMAVLHTADEMDDIIIQKWGGQRAIDRRG